MKTLGCKTLGLVMAMVLLVAVAALAADQCPMSKSDTTSASSSADRSSSVVETSSTYMGRYNYDNASASCLFDALRKDHREIMSHLNAIANGRVGDRQEHWAELRQVLLPHMQAEERTLYPALQETSSGRMKGLAGEEEHAAAAAVFQKLDGGDFTSDRWTARFGVLKEMIEHHIAEEQGSIFSAARRALSADQLRDLCANFMEQKQAALNSMPRTTQPASYQSSSSMQQPSGMPSMYERSTGFDTMGTQNMGLRCPQCGREIGTVCVAEQSCVDYDETPASSQAPATTSQTIPNQTMDRSEATPATGPVATGAEQPAPPMMYDQMGTMRCPGCGAVMGTVCPYAPGATPTPTGMNNGSSTTGTGNNGTTKY